MKLNSFYRNIRRGIQRIIIEPNSIENGNQTHYKMEFRIQFVGFHLCEPNSP